MNIIKLDDSKDRDEQINQLMMKAAAQDIEDSDEVQKLVKKCLSFPLDDLTDNDCNEMQYFHYCKGYLEYMQGKKPNFTPMKDKDGNIYREFDDVATYFKVPLERAKQIANGTMNLHFGTF